MNERWQEAHEAQMKFCEERNLPVFAQPACFNCWGDIYERIGLERAGSEHITGCPLCGKSFCE